MTKAISMTIELDQDIMVTNMCLKFGEDWTNGFQELDRKQSSGRTYVQTDRRTYGQGQPYMPPLCGGIKNQRTERLVMKGCYIQPYILFQVFMLKN